MTHTCTCGRPIQDTATICPTCGTQLDAAIADISAYHGLAYDLDITLTRQTRMNTRDGSRPTEAAVAFDPRAGQAAAELMTALRKWAYVVKTDTGTGYPPRKMAALAAWLRPRIGWLRYHERGPEALEQILDAVHQARRICDRPADRLYAGPCDCGEDLYARLDAAYVTCHNETHEQPIAWEVEARRRWLLDSAADVLATATEISRALTRYAQPVTPSALRGYVHRGQLISRGERVEGSRMVMLYRLGDVLDILQRQAERIGA